MGGELFSTFKVFLYVYVVVCTFYQVFKHNIRNSF